MAKRPKDGKVSPEWGGKRDGAGRVPKPAHLKRVSFTISIPQGLAQEILREAQRTGETRGEVVARKFFWRG